MPRQTKPVPELPIESIRSLGRRLIGPKKWKQKFVTVDVEALDKVHKYLAYFAKKKYAETYKNLYT